ncbi:hypothetical protein RJ55_01262 [Drechmeria coniospora]|nr:hypothetical protein RJ55_01262 [Drechmeria coniospora]
MGRIGGPWQKPWRQGYLLMLSLVLQWDYSTLLNKMPQVKDKNSQPIEEGDHVWTRFRGGHREGQAEDIVTTEQEAREAQVKHPPKVIFTDQHGHRVSHNPETLEHVKN